jgi:FADH2 O2-dependent halogenase
VTADCDLAIVGSGFGGSLLAAIAARLGYRVLLLERGRHPRFAIGESASPLAGIVLEQLADRYDLPRVRPLAAYGPWQRACPDVVCGLKRGFSYFKHEQGKRYAVAAGRTNQLLVAASPNDEVSDTHWLRSDVDGFLVREAIAAGAGYVDCVALDRAEISASSARLSGNRHGRAFSIAARFVIDATGPRGFLAQTLGIPNRGFDGYPGTQALYSHFTGVARCADMPEYGFAGARVRGCDGAEVGAVPFPPDAAALHHVFDGGWMWVLRFGNGVTSAGIAVHDALAAELRLADREPAWARFLARYPSIAEQFAEAVPIREFTWLPRLAWRAERAAGPRWAMLPSAAAFVDPLFSTGIPLTLLGIERLARALESGPEGPPLRHSTRSGGPSGPPLEAHGADTLADADHTAQFIAGCYAAFPRFELFTAYSMFYFAAASFAEMARRLDVQPASARFLCADRQPFAEAMRLLSPATNTARDQARYAQAVAEAVDCLNVAGLCDPAKGNWYSVEVEDTIRNAVKLGVTAQEVARVCV